MLGKIKLIHTHIRFNRETNTIVKSLNLIEDIEKLIDPHYLLHPRIEERLQNLEIVEMIYTKIGNLRGIAINDDPPSIFMSIATKIFRKKLHAYCNTTFL